MGQEETGQRGNGPRGNRPERKWVKRKQAREQMDQMETDQRGNRPELQVKRSEETDGDCPGKMIGPNNSKSKKARHQSARELISVLGLATDPLSSVFAFSKRS